MKRVAVISWPKGGNIQLITHKLLQQFHAYQDEVKVDELDFLSVDEKKIRTYDVLVIGGATIYGNNWLKADSTTKWASFFELIKFADLTGKKTALFASGNQSVFPENFADGMSELSAVLKQKGAKIIGQWPTEGYDFLDSKSVDGDYFIGLVLDNEIQPELTDMRIKNWVDQLMTEI